MVSKAAGKSSSVRAVTSPLSILTMASLWLFGGGGGRSRGSHDPPPPPLNTKLKIYPRNILQNPPYCTNLQISTNSGGMPPDPPNLGFPFARCQILIHKQYSQKLNSKIPQQTKILTPPLQTLLESGLDLSELTSAEYFILL